MALMTLLSSTVINTTQTQN